MTKDYFQDITPPGEDSEVPRQEVRPQPAPAPSANFDADDDLDTPKGPQEIPVRINGGSSEPMRGIRTIQSSRQTRPRIEDMREAPAVPGMLRGAPRLKQPPSRWWMWGAAAVALIVVLGLGLLALRKTTVTVIPHSHLVILTSTTQYVAYPAATAASGTLAYTVQASDLTDSDVVPVSGTTTSPASKASGSITVYNAYSTSAVRLIKNTRFETPDGLIFRAPADISVPGRKGTVPGKVQVTMVADQNGSQYNLGPISRFTIPGLKTSAMYTKVYASSLTPMTGGSSGVSGQGVAPETLTSTISDLQNRLQAKARDAIISQAGPGNIILPQLIQITYSSQPNTPEAGGTVRIHESAHVEIPVFSTSALAGLIGSAVSADTAGQSLTLVPGTGFAAVASGTPVLGTDPVSFTLTGQASIVWNVDTQALAQDLAGRNQGAFQTIIGGFPSIQEAHAKVEPFWKNTFPIAPQDIKIIVTPPQA